jgi:hypothetical protein
MTRSKRVLGSVLLLSLILGFAAKAAFAAIAADAALAKDSSAASTTIATPGFNTTASNELLLVFVATDYKSGTNMTVKSIAGAGLTWTLGL